MMNLRRLVGLGVAYVVNDVILLHFTVQGVVYVATCVYT
jgi:hypothetical protein